MKKYQLKSLQSEIKDATAESRAFNPKIQAASGLERHALRLEKKGLAYPTRVKLLAYGMLRGIPYRVMERNAGCLPYHGSIHKEAVKFQPDLTTEQCQAWLEAAQEATAPAAEAAQ